LTSNLSSKVRNFLQACMDVKFRVYRRQIPPFSFKNRFRSLLPLQIPPPRSTTRLGACSNSKIYLSQPRTCKQAYVDFKFLLSKLLMCTGGTVAECGSLDVDHVSVGRFSPQTLYNKCLCFGIGTASERPWFSDVRCCIWLYVFSLS